MALDFSIGAMVLAKWPAVEIFFTITANVPPRYLLSYNNYAPEVIEQWGGWEKLRSFPADRPVLFSRYRPDAVDFNVTTCRFAHEWAKPQGLIDDMMLPVAMDDKGVGMLGFGRHRDAGLVGEIELEAARLLMPHLRRVVTINQLLDMAALARTTFENSLDAMSVPVLLVTAEMTFAHANSAARELIAAGDLLQAQHGRLASASGKVWSALTAAVTEAARDESAVGGLGLSLPLQRADGAPAALHVLPLRPSRRPKGSDAVAAIFVAEGDRLRVAPIELISSFFGLTKAEARIFEKIAAGHTLARVVETLAIKQSTARTHLLRIFAKTGTGRQARYRAPGHLACGAGCLKRVSSPPNRPSADWWASPVDDAVAHTRSSHWSSVIQLPCRNQSLSSGLVSCNWRCS